MDPRNIRYKKEAEIKDGIKNAPFYLFVCLFLCLFAQKPENLTASSSTINSFVTPFSPVRLVACQARPSISILQIYDEDDAVVLSGAAVDPVVHTLLLPHQLLDRE